MRRIRYQVASSLDGYIAGPQGEYDWIVDEPDIDFNEIYRQFDTLLMGRRTFEILPAGSEGSHRIVVVSHTL
ncbi:MAG TPA: dihydrofolate reductase family protein, partial [Steroidobacteraceae bacterium]